MNAEALTHAAKACRESADFLTRAADDADLLLHRAPDAGCGMRQASNDMRARAIGLKVAAAFLARCAKAPGLSEALFAIELGSDVIIVPPGREVVVRNHEQPPAPPTLRARVRSLVARLPFARAA